MLSNNRTLSPKNRRTFGKRLIYKRISNCYYTAISLPSKYGGRHLEYQVRCHMFDHEIIMFCSVKHIFLKREDGGTKMIVSLPGVMFPIKSSLSEKIGKLSQ